MIDKILQLPLLGRLGNQMFIYAAGRAIAIKEIRKIIYSEHNYSQWHNESRLDCFKLSDDVAYKKSLTQTIKQKIGQFIYMVCCRHKDINQVFKMEKKWQWLFRMCDMFMCQEGYMEPGDFKCDNLFVFGYFQSDKYFKEYETEIRKDFVFKTELFCEDARSLGTKIASNPNSVSIHIRRGDYLKDPIFNVCGNEYYYRAIDKMAELVPTAHYYVFSDDIEDVKKLFEKYTDKTFTYIDSKFTDQESMYLGSCCNHFIMTNSSYSWWMQFLSKNPKKHVLAPNRWFGVKRPCDIYQDNWTLVEV